MTSASLMVCRAAAEDAAAYARATPALSVGLHVELGEWQFEDGDWKPTAKGMPTDGREAVAQEVRRQLELFRDVVGREPTHLDSHRHVHRHEPVTSLLGAEAAALGVPLREFTPSVRSYGGFYGQTKEGAPLPDAVGVEALRAILASLPPGLTELVCHPGEAADLESSYRQERERELETLCDPRVRVAVAHEQIELRSFRDFPTRAIPT